MNLKESFRYQNFLNDLLTNAYTSIMNSNHCLEIKRTHRKSESNPEAQDVVEVLEVSPFAPNDDVIKFIIKMISEKSKLTESINRAKSKLPYMKDFDLDAAIESNKSRQSAIRAIQNMIVQTTSKKIEKGMDYKFNAEGNQVPYYYSIETESSELYDREESKAIMKRLMSESNEVSNQIEAALINTKVDYEPLYDITESFEDIIGEFSKK